MRSISIKAGQLLMVTIFCISVFALLYKSFSVKRSTLDSIYTSTMLQTMNGGNTTPSNYEEKIIMALQSILTFFITSGIIIVVVNSS